MRAALSMYDRAENAALHDALWCAIRDRMAVHGLDAPVALERRADPAALWLAPDLVLGQTCGLPYRTRLHGSVALIATFDYGLEDCAPGHYRSVFVVRRDAGGSDPADFADARFAYNQPDSHSGWAAPQNWARARGFAFRPVLATGSHRATARAVAEGRADIGALDAVTWRDIERWEPALAGRLRVTGHSDTAPGLPLIAARGLDAGLIRQSVAEALTAVDGAVTGVLGIRGLAIIAAADYMAVPTPPAPA